MRKITQSLGSILLSFLLFSFLILPQKALSQAAPEKYEGVMLQAFFWDSFKESNWVALENQADEISASFSLVWLPPSGNDLLGHMGYHPVYYFNQNSSFGSQDQLKSLIATLKSKGTGSIADIVVNHRNGVTNWTDFPVETYKGVTYKWGPEAICSNDEVKDQPSQAKPTGNVDTGEGWSGARDIDHTNENVRNTIKAYLDFMKNEMGYSGWRWDVAKGFSAWFMGDYAKSAGCEFSVGEYWDGQFDALAGYIDGTKIDGQIRTGAFDFSLKYLLNEACNNGAWDKLSWKRYGTIDQPAGLIHSDGFARFAYTFVDNHDTWRPGTDAHNGAVKQNELAANAFILAHPGIPCVFLPHWRDFKNELKPMIDARNMVGIHNQSEVRVIETGKDIYAAEVFGSKGSLVIKVGPKYSFALPEGYTMKCSGQNYAIWTKGGVAAPVINLSVSPDAGTYATDTTVTLTATGDNAPFNIYYTIDGTIPTLSSTKVTSGYQLNITQNTTLKLLGVDSKGNQSLVITKNYKIGEQPKNEITVRWRNDQKWVGSMYFYSWNDSGVLSGAWPGKLVTADAEGWYSYTLDTDMANVVFTNNAGAQTADITNVTASTCYKVNADKNLKGQNTVTAIDCDQSPRVTWTPLDPETANTIVITCRTATASSKLHWGVNNKAGTWMAPIAAYQPQGTISAGITAVETPFVESNGKWQVVLGPFLDAAQEISSIDFVINHGNNVWDNNDNLNYTIAVKKSEIKPNLPTAANVDRIIKANQTYSFTVSDFGFASKDTNEFKSVIIVSLPLEGMLLLDENNVLVGQEINVTELTKLTYIAPEFGDIISNFTFKVKDSKDYVSESEYTASFIVQPLQVNPKPLGADSQKNISVSASYTFTATDFGFQSAIGNRLRAIYIVEIPNEGGLTLAGQPVSSGQLVNVKDLPSLVYTASGAPGEDILTFKVFDTQNQIAENTNKIIFTIESSITNPNLPSGVDFTKNIYSNNSYTFTAADFGFESTIGNRLRAIYIMSVPSTGSLTLSGLAVKAGQLVNVKDLPLLVYTASETLGDDSFGFKVFDTQNQVAEIANTAIFNVQEFVINPDLPTGIDVTKSIHQNGSYTFSATDFGFQSSIGNRLRAIHIVSLPSAGSLTLSGIAVKAGQIVNVKDLPLLVYKASTGSIASFTYKVHDTQNLVAALENTVTFNIGATLKALVNDNFETEVISIYPNPVEEVLYIKGLSEEIINATILNMNGMAVSKTSDLTNGIQISDLIKGVYFIQLKKNTGETITLKFIKK